MPVFNGQRDTVRYLSGEEGAVPPAKLGATRARPIDKEIQKTAYAGFGLEQVFPGRLAPHGRHLIDRLADANADIFTAFVPATIIAHDLPPDRQHTVFPVIMGITHDKFTAGIIAVQGQGGCDQGLKGAVIQIDVVG